MTDSDIAKVTKVIQDTTLLEARKKVKELIARSKKEEREHLGELIDKRVKEHEDMLRFMDTTGHSFWDGVRHEAIFISKMVKRTLVPYHFSQEDNDEDKD